MFKPKRGKIFGLLTLVEPAKYKNGISAVWKCLCACGKTCYRSILGFKGEYEFNLSCGCLKQELFRKKCQANKKRFKITTGRVSKKAWIWLFTIKNNYGLSAKDWSKLVIQSNGRCMLQGEQFKNPRDCHIDHDHKTGKVRGLLCARCNHLLAGLDNLEFRQDALKYLGDDQV